MGGFSCVVESHEESALYVFVLNGELDIYSAPKLKETLLERISPNVSLIIDCTNLIFIDSTGLGTLAGALKDVSNVKAQMSLAAINKNIKRVLTVTGLDRLFSIYSTVDEAREAALSSPLVANPQ